MCVKTMWADRTRAEGKEVIRRAAVVAIYPALQPTLPRIRISFRENVEGGNSTPAFMVAAQSEHFSWERHMRGFSKSSFAAALTLLASSACLRASPLDRLSPANPNVVQVQYGDLCANWHRQCARLWGVGTQRWNDCMNQPQALADCGRGGYGGGGYYQQGGDLCGNWHNECVRLYGWRTRTYRDCMHQPQALADCGRY
jgi:hypothetical protein